MNIALVLQSLAIISVVWLAYSMVPWHDVQVNLLIGIEYKKFANFGDIY